MADGSEEDVDIDEVDFDAIVRESTESSCQIPAERCILHIGDGGRSGQLRKIDPNSWGKIVQASRTRKGKKEFESSKYKHIVETLPSSFDDSMGYHSRCYSNFLSVSASSSTQCPDDDTETEITRRTRSASPMMNVSRTGLFSDACLYCGKQTKTMKNGKKEHLHTICEIGAAENILHAAQVTNDHSILSKISGIDMIAKEVKVHNSCRAARLSAANRQASSGPRSQSKQDDALDEILYYVRKQVIENNRPELMTSILNRYHTICECNGATPSISSAQWLKETLMKKFPSELRVTSSSVKKHGMIAHSAALSYESIRAVFDFNSSDEGKITRAALLLRQSLKAVEKCSIDETDVQSILRGEGECPDLMRNFFFTLFGCRDTDATDEMRRRVDSISQDCLYTVHNGTLKPKKHILLGMSVKSMTGSKKLLTMLNRFGHCISYSKAEEIETALATAILERKERCPPGVNRDSVVGLAFDNYDELTQTLSGHNTLHDTMGILYCEPCNLNLDEGQNNARPSNLSGSKRKRSLQVSRAEIEPYRKKPRMKTFSYSNLHIPDSENEIDQARRKDALLLMVHGSPVASQTFTPMWIGFNARIHTDDLPMQVVHYLPNLNQPITRPDVVAETMRIATEAAREIDQPYGLVTYDLDVAKVAQRIKSTSEDEYGNLFIMLGGFHIFLCFFRALGKVIEHSGGPELLVEAGLLAPGSLRGFVGCFNYNRCRRLHPILSLAIETMHFRKFLEVYPKNELLHTILTMDVDNIEDLKAAMGSEEFKEVYDAYTTFRAETANGERGPTAQFWMMYVGFVDLYHQLERAIRENKIDMFTSLLSPLVAMFFATNRCNYSRWLTKYQLDLAHMDTAMPGLRRLLENGGFSVRRTSNQFSRVPIDLTLEQTINADAASRLTGFCDSTNNYSARLRWAITKSTRAAIVSECSASVGINSADGPEQELQPSRISRDNKDLRNLICHLGSNINPFDLQEEDRLINISTGKSVSSEIKDSLLSIPQVGKDLHQRFLDECIIDPDRFEKPIKRNKLLTFADACVSSRPIKTKEIELRCTSELMGRIAFVAASQQIDLRYVFSYPLTPVPLSMARCDGTMMKTDKSKLLCHLEKTVSDHGVPERVDCHLIDGNFLLHSLNADQPKTYGGLSRNILLATLNHKSKRVDILFDTYERPSLKDSERERRGSSTEYRLLIRGPEQNRDESYRAQLQRENFKRDLPLFLAEDWKSPHYAPLLQGRIVHLGVMNKCYRFVESNGAVLRETVPQLFCNHPEADTRLILHAIDSAAMSSDIVIRASDTDILVISLYHLNKIPPSVSLWMEVGNVSAGNRRYISVNKIAESVGQSMCLALPGLHAMTGCDYTSAFCRKGKIRPFELTTVDQSFQHAFANMACEPINDENREILKQFVCKLYGAKGTTTTLNEHRFKIVETAYKQSVDSKPFEKLKSINGSAIPPCESELEPHIDRASFVARMWASSCQTELIKTPDSGGWSEDLSQLVWFVGEQMPPSFIPTEEIVAEEAEIPGPLEMEWDE